MTTSTQTHRTATAPATIGNVGPGFDVLGIAVSGLADRVTASAATHGEIRITSITDRATGGTVDLPTDPAVNTAGVAAEHTRRAAGHPGAGVDLVIEKGIPLESGLGSSAASAAAAAFAVNHLLGAPLRATDLIGPCVEAEGAVAGRHADNVAPALLGGLVLVRLVDGRFQAHRLPVPKGLLIVAATPKASVATKSAREVLPQTVPLAARTVNSANLAALVGACYAGDPGLLAGCIEDKIVEEARLPLIPGGAEAINAARAAGAIGASISGAGPTVFAFCHAQTVAETISARMTEAFDAAGVSSSVIISPADCPGAGLVHRGGLGHPEGATP